MLQMPCPWICSCNLPARQSSFSKLRNCHQGLPLKLLSVLLDDPGSLESYLDPPNIPQIPTIRGHKASINGPLRGPGKPTAQRDEPQINAPPDMTAQD